MDEMKQNSVETLNSGGRKQRDKNKAKRRKK